MIFKNHKKRRDEFMKKILKPIFIGLLTGLMLSSCAQQIKVNKGSGISFYNNLIKKNYYKKDAKSSFSEFLKNPDDNSRRALNARAARLAEEDCSTKITEEEMFAQIWTELSEDEKKMILKNTENISIQFESAIGVNVDSSVGRAAANGDTRQIENLAEYYGIIETLKAIGENKKIPASYLGTEFEVLGLSDVDAAQVLEMYIRNEDWEKIQDILSYIGESEKYREIEERWNNLNRAWDATQTAERSSSSTSETYSDPLVDNVGSKLSDGDVLVTISKDKAYAICGNWSHGGIFSKDLYDNDMDEITKKGTDAAYCVYTAQPGTYDENFIPVNDTEPDRWGVACLETIHKYTKAKKFAVLHPKDYSKEKAKNAVLEAKETFYKKEAPYNLPWWELLFLGDSSHDLTNSNTYCTKVVYTAWKKNGVDLDADNFAGNLVSPDEIYGSSVQRTCTVTISLVWWSWSKTWVTYEPTTTVVMEEYR